MVTLRIRKTKTKAISRIQKASTTSYTHQDTTEADILNTVYFRLTW